MRFRRPKTRLARVEGAEEEEPEEEPEGEGEVAVAEAALIVTRRVVR